VADQVKLDLPRNMIGSIEKELRYNNRELHNKIPENESETTKHCWVFQNKERKIIV
jgi:hypothetical protein